MKSTVIAIAGGTGSGKTTLTKKLEAKYNGKISVLSFDNYYKKHDDMPFELRQKINYDSPEALDITLAESHLKMLKSGKSIACPVYDFKEHNRTADTLLIEPSQLLIVEGILVLAIEEIRSLCDAAIFVDTAADERILRRIERDAIGRGRAVDDIISQYRTTVRPMHNKYVEPSKSFADLILSGENIDESTVENAARLIEKHR